MDSQSGSTRLQIGHFLINGPLRAFRHSQFRLFWAASWASIMSFMMTMIARGWLVLQMTDSPFMVTAVQAVFMSPMMVLPPFGGVIADRLNRRMVLIAGDVANLLTLLILVALLFTELVQVWHVFALSLLSGASFALAMPTRVASVPDLVGQGELASGMALYTTVFSSAQLIGPALAGYLMSIDPDQLGWAFLAASLLLVQGLGLLLPLRLPRKEPGLERVSGATVLGSIVEGMAYIRGRGLLVGLLLLGLVFALFGMPYQVLLPVFARDILHTGPDGLGLLAAAGGAGAIVGSFTVAFFSTPRQLQALMLGGALLFGVGVVLFALSTLFPLSLVLALGLGYLMQVTMTCNLTLVQLASPGYIRGRIIGLRFVIMGLGPIGIFLLGFGAETLGAAPALAMMGAMAMALIAAVLLKFHALRRIRAELEDRAPEPTQGHGEPATPSLAGDD